MSSPRPWFRSLRMRSRTVGSRAVSIPPSAVVSVFGLDVRKKLIDEGVTRPFGLTLGINFTRAKGHITHPAVLWKQFIGARETLLRLRQGEGSGSSGVALPEGDLHPDQARSQVA